MNSFYLHLLVVLLSVEFSSCKKKRVIDVIESEGAEGSSGFYLTPLEQISRIISANANSGNMDTRGLERQGLRDFLKSGEVDSNSRVTVGSLAEGIDYILSKGPNQYRIEQIQTRLYSQIDFKKVLVLQIEEALIKEGVITKQDSPSHYIASILERLSGVTAISEMSGKSRKAMVSALRGIKNEKTAAEFIQKYFGKSVDLPTLKRNFEIQFQQRTIHAFDPFDILTSHGFKTDGAKTKFSKLDPGIRDELLRYAQNLSFDQKKLLYDDIISRINKNPALVELRGKVLVGEVARKIPFDVLMESMVENRSVFGSYIVKKIQQEFSRLNSQGIVVDQDVRGFLKLSQSRGLPPEEAARYLERAKKLLPNHLKDGSKVLSAGSLGIVFETHDGKIVKWVPDEAFESLMVDRQRYMEIRDKLGAGVGLQYPEKILQGNLQLEYRRRIYNLWQAKIDEIDEFIAETNLAKESENGVKSKNYNVDIATVRGGKVGSIRAVGGEKVTADMIDSGVIGDLDERRRLAKQFNLQEKAQGRDLEWFNDPKNHHMISGKQRVQIQNSLQKLMDAHFHAIFSGQHFHGDLHEGNIKILLNPDHISEVKLIGLIDLGTIGYLDMYERQALKGLFDVGIAKEMIDDPDLVKKILYHNYSKFPEIQKRALMEMHGITEIEFDAEKIKRLDTDIKYFMTGLSKDGFGLSVDALNMKEYGVFLNMIAGKPIPVDEPLRLLNLRPHVVSAFKAVSTGVGVIENSNKAAAKYVGSELPLQVIQKTRADIFQYFSDTIKYNLQTEQDVLLMDQSRIEHTRNSLPPEAAEYVRARFLKGEKMDVSPTALWKKILFLEEENVRLAGELKSNLLELENIRGEISLLRIQLQERTDPQEVLDMEKKISKLEDQLKKDAKKYSELVKTMQKDHETELRSLRTQLEEMTSANATQKQEIEKHLKALQLKESERLTVVKESSDRLLKIDELEAQIDLLKGDSGRVDELRLANQELNSQLQKQKESYTLLEQNSQKRIK